MISTSTICLLVALYASILALIASMDKRWSEGEITKFEELLERGTGK